MGRMAGLFKKVADFLDFFGPLVEFARNFTGFTAFTAFLIIAGLFLVPLMFSQGVFDEFIVNFSKLTPDQTFQFLLILTVAFFGVIFTLIGLSYQDNRVSADRRNVLQVIVHEEGDRTKPIAGAEVVLTLDEVKADSTNDGGRASFQIGPEWLNKQRTINVSHESYEDRSPQVELLRPSNQVFLALKKKIIPGQGRVLIFCRAIDEAVAMLLAEILQDRGIDGVMVNVSQSDNAPQSLDLATEQHIWRAKVVVILVAEMVGETLPPAMEFAQGIGTPVIPILLTERGPLPTSLLVLEPIVWVGKEAPVIDQLLRRLQRVTAEPLPEPPPVKEPLPPKEPGPKPLQQPVSPTDNGRPPTPINPFICGNSVPPEWFFGRRIILDTIRDRLSMRLQSTSIVANRRIGKSSLLNYIAQRPQDLLPQDQQWVMVYLDMMDARTHDVVGIMRLLRQNIRQQLGYDIWPESADGQLPAMAEGFEQLYEADLRLVLCLDEWEAVMAYPELDPLLDQLRSSGSKSHVGMVVATAHSLSELEKNNGLVSRFNNIFAVRHLGLMPTSEWMALVVKYFERGGRLIEQDKIDLIGELSGGHPYLVQLAGSLFWEGFSRGWGPAEVCARYERQARGVFTLLWGHLSALQQNAMLEAVGLPTHVPVSVEVWMDLRERGMLTAEGLVFCEPFAEYVRSQELGLRG